MQMMLCLPKP
uniref:Uncharacterized protein n=1 Tax=Arundo donax TaxID=35708 RepID=A0A0A9ELN1_ARUDO